MFLKYVLREPNDGMVRFLGTGRIERDGLHGLSVYDDANVLKQISPAQRFEVGMP